MTATNAGRQDVVDSSRDTRVAGQDSGPWWRPRLSVEALFLLASAWFVLAMNGPLWAAVQAANGALRVQLALGVAVFALQALLLGLLCWWRLARPLLALLLVVTALAHWYMTRYAVVFDAEMIRNVLHTDVAESRELLSVRMVLHVLLLGVLPATLVMLTRPVVRGWRRGLLLRAGFLLTMALLTAGALASASQGILPMMRSDPVLRYKITPGNFIVSLVNVLKPSRKGGSGPIQQVGLDAARPPAAQARKPRLLVLVVGETVRGDHWGLNGYARQTTPALAARGVVNFRDVVACGTSTEVSLPCMLSPFGRARYDRDAIRSHESVLDVAARAGVGVLWRDNQSGCKGTCARVPNHTMGPDDAPGLCADGRCLDEILLAGLQAKIDAMPGDALIVLHMLGNHGPNYFERYPAAYKRWQPVCATAELSRCPARDIVNAYDNAILYSDAVLGRAIDLLRNQAGHDAALLYVSDHGESLGEYGLFLHGAPYAIAPRQQLHVPMALWLSAGMVQDAGIDMACLQAQARRPASHDNLFSTVLGLFDVQSGVYQRGQDLLAGCRHR